MAESRGKGLFEFGYLRLGFQLSAMRFSSTYPLPSSLSDNCNQCRILRSGSLLDLLAGCFSTASTRDHMRLLLPARADW
jgi:hypothetical protein